MNNLSIALTKLLIHAGIVFAAILAAALLFGGAGAFVVIIAVLIYLTVQNIKSLK